MHVYGYRPHPTQDCLVAAAPLPACTPGSGQPGAMALHVRSTAPAQHPHLTYGHGPPGPAAPRAPLQLQLDLATHAWGHYVAAAWNGAHEWLALHGAGPGPGGAPLGLAGACIMVDDIPPGKQPH